MTRAELNAMEGRRAAAVDKGARAFFAEMQRIAAENGDTLVYGSTYETISEKARDEMRACARAVIDSL